MQVSKQTLRLMKVEMKKYYPAEYALVVVERLRTKGVITTLQQVYNFFNCIPVKKRSNILDATIELIKEAKEREKQINEMLGEISEK